MQNRYVSPLRYPGGKATMAPWLSELFDAQYSGLPIEIWMEPFAGGAGAALTLLDRDAVEEAWLIDLNPGLAAFWATVVGDGEDLARRVELTVPNMELWEESRAIVAEPEAFDQFELGYATFIVNRCSRSGIVTPAAGPMGGKDQTGHWTLGSRFTADALADRIRRIATFRDRLRVFHGDGISFIEDVGDSGFEDEVMMFVDPPYIREGNRLYTNGFDMETHLRLANALNSTSARWVLTYDDEPVVSDELYPDRRLVAYDIRNTANRARTAREFAVFSDNLNLTVLPPGAHASAPEPDLAA